MKTPTKMGGLLLLAAVVLIGLILIGGGILAAAGEFLVHADELRRGGAVVLLSGGGPERMDEAARLMRERYAELLILTDTDQLMPAWQPEEGQETGVQPDLLEWEYIRQEMIARGVSPAQIQPTYHVVSNTNDEAVAVREYMQQHQISSCIVVTDPYHTRRTRQVFLEEMAGTGIEVLVVPARDHWYRPTTWFFSLRGWRATASEYVKLAVEILR